jgi:pyridoxal phosphate enzyme (YggS family)
MTTATERIGKNLAAIRARIAAAADRAGRSPAGVQLLVVTKMVGPEETAALLDCGVAEIGENRVQDALGKAEALGETAARFNWQLLGHLQTNKVKKALGLLSGMHSLDSVRLAEALEKEMAARRPDDRFAVYVEVNTSADAAKTGAGEPEVRAIFERLKTCPHLAPAGLMTMGPLEGGPEAARPCFKRLRELLATLRAEGLAPENCTGLSMGMTGDFEAAVEEGATVVRIGTAVFA